MKFPKIRPTSNPDEPPPLPNEPQTTTAAAASAPPPPDATRDDAIPFTGVPPPPPPTGSESATAPTQPHDSTSKKSLFHRFKKPARRQSVEFLPDDQTSAPPLPAASQPASQTQPPPQSVLPPPAGGQMDSIARTAQDDARAAQREKEANDLRFIEISSGVSMKTGDASKAHSNANGDDDDTDDERGVQASEEWDEESRRIARAEGKPEHDAVIGSVEDRTIVPSDTVPTSGFTTHGATDGERGTGMQNISAHSYMAAPGDGTRSVNICTTSFGETQGVDAASAPAAADASAAIPPPPSSQSNAAEMAEMFASRAFGTAGLTHPTPFPKQPPPLQPPPPPPPPQMYDEGKPGTVAPANPQPVGWGSISDTMPSQPLYGPPVHLAQSRGPLDLDTHTSDKLRRGRELGILAVQQEEAGNLGAAEAGYIKALSLLIPACKDLDLGSDLNKHVRQTQKAKVQREAAAMLDRCEELRRFLKANGPAVPQELPSMPGEAPSRKSGGSSGGGGGSGGGGTRSNSENTHGEAPEVPSRTTKPKGVIPGKHKQKQRHESELPPPPPPPSATLGHIDDFLATRLESRKNVLLTPSAPPPDTDAMPPEDTSQPSEHIPGLPPPPSSSSSSVPSVEKSPAATQQASNDNTPRKTRDISFLPPGQATAPPPPPFPEAEEEAAASHDGSGNGNGGGGGGGSGSAMPTDDLSQGAAHMTLSDSSETEGDSGSNERTAKCFLCNADAQLRTKCQHTFCSSCGNQAVSVFGQCPVPGCNKELAIDEFEHILR